MRSSLLLLGAALALVSCEAKFDWPWLDKNASPGKDHPSGQVVTVDRTVSAFDKVSMEGVGRLVFDPAVATGTVRVVADQGILPTIQTTVVDGQLRIKEDGLQGPGSWDIEFRLAPPANLKEIVLGGMGTISATAPMATSENLEVRIQGMGKIELNLDAPSVTADQRGSGEMVLTGKAGAVKVLAQGLGRVDVSQLISPTADVQSQGVGEVNVYASQSLKVRAQGLGAVHFSGNPKTTDVQTEGLTQVKAAD
jgi:hypothetical protein